MEQHRDRLRRMIELQMNPKLQGRVDPSDVIHETFIEAVRVFQNKANNPEIPVYLWLRRLAQQKLIQAHRQHLGAAQRDINREQHLDPATDSQASAANIAQYLVGNFTSPSKQAIRHKQHDAVLQSLEAMPPLDREVMALRHFEQLTGPETAEILGISHEAVKKRYLRALERLQKLMSE